MDITGKYINELGSIMEILSTENCELKGTYKSGVGTTFSYPLIGSYDYDGQALGWAVSYQQSNSTCTWSGQAFENDEGCVCIHTTWLLASKTSMSDIWMSTNIGTDVFRPICEGDSMTVSACPKMCNIPGHVLEKEKL